MTKPKPKLPKIPKHPDGTPMLKLTDRGTLERTKYKGKLWALPSGYKIPPEFFVTPENRARSTPICGANKPKKSGTIGKCCQPAGWGTEHVGYGLCKLHGGSTPNHTKKAIVEREKENMAVYGDKIEVDPHTAVLETVHRTAGHVAWLFDKIQALSEVEGDMTLHQYTAMGIRASVWVEMYERERMMLLRASKAAVDMGVSERQVQLAEEQGRMIAMVLQQFIDSQEIALSPSQRSLAPKVIRQLLSAMPMAAKPGQSVVSPVNTPPDPSSSSLAPAAKEEEEWEEF